jgi:ATP-dependent 26S proteasome regulatory subunit
MPDEAGRAEIATVHMRAMPVGAHTEGGAARAAIAADIARRTPGWSGAELAHLCREAAMVAMRRDRAAACVTAGDFAAAWEVAAAQRAVRQRGV